MVQFFFVVPSIGYCKVQTGQIEDKEGIDDKVLYTGYDDQE